MATMAQRAILTDLRNRFHAQIADHSDAVILSAWDMYAISEDYCTDRAFQSFPFYVADAVCDSLNPEY